MRKITILITILVFLFNIDGSAQNDKIKVLNVGVFHMGETSDAHSTEYNEESKKAKQEIKEVCEALSKFNPTIILVEEQPKHQEGLKKAYNSYLKNKKIKTIYSNNEIELLGFEIGRLTHVKKIYAIDHKLSYNYDLWSLAKKTNATKFFEMAKKLKKLQDSVIADPKKIGLKKMMQIINTNEGYDFLINANADILMYANPKEGFEGADEAAKYYKRNIRIFANINKIPMTKEDRVLIISGGSHAAFLSKFLKRSMIYELESINKYLKIK